jgi:hypothetical protein
MVFTGSAHRVSARCSDILLVPATIVTYMMDKVLARCSCSSRRSAVWLSAYTDRPHSCNPAAAAAVPAGLSGDVGQQYCIHSLNQALASTRLQ